MIKHEIYRKLIHLGAIIIPILYYFVLKNQLLAVAVLLPLAIICVIIDAARIENPQLKNRFYKIFGAQLREKEATYLTGASYLLSSSVVTIALFRKEIAFLAISYLVIGDTFAAFFGLTLGKRKIINTNKSLEGWIGAFVTNSIFGLLVYFLFFKDVFSDNANINPEPYIIMILAGAFIASVVEIIDIHINDNVTIPILSGIGMTILFMII